MKKFIMGFMSAIVLMAACSFTDYVFPKKASSILLDGVQFYGMKSDVGFLPFCYNGKYGFTGKTDRVQVLIEPIFDDIYNNDSPMVPVKMNGKWGVVDVSGITGSTSQPLIKCQYDWVKIRDDYHIIAGAGGKTIELDIRNYR